MNVYTIKDKTSITQSQVKQQLISESA